MIQGRSVPNSLRVAPNAKLKLRREPPFITGHHHAKCFAPIVVMHLTVSFSQVLLMKMSLMVQVIRMPGKLKERGFPFFDPRQLEDSLPTLESPDQQLYLFNGSSFILADLLIFSVMVSESSFLHLVAFHLWFTEYSSD